ncbi:hypothetical protein OSTOST_19242 [Ostertagia ostertagi]
MPGYFRMSSSDLCTRKKWDIKMALNGLHLRRSELARDCVQKNINDATISESILDPDELKSCPFNPCQVSIRPRKQAEKTLFKKLQKDHFEKEENVSDKIMKAYRIRRIFLSINLFLQALSCRKDTKLWHKQCSEIAKCCPLTEDCKVNAKEIMEQIHDERRKLRELIANCD